MALFCAFGTPSQSPASTQPDPLELMAQMLNNQERKRILGTADGSLTSAHMLDLATARLLRQQAAVKQHYARKKAAIMASAINSFISQETLESSLPRGPGLANVPCAADQLQLSANGMPLFAALPPFPGSFTGEASDGDLEGLLQTLGSGETPSPACDVSKSEGSGMASSTLVSRMETSDILDLLQHIQQEGGAKCSEIKDCPPPLNHPAASASATWQELSCDAGLAFFPKSSSLSSSNADSAPSSLGCAGLQAYSAGSAPQTSEERKQRRLAGNREAARRLRKRHSERVSEMEGEINKAKRMHRDTCDALERARARIAELEKENLRLEMEAQEARLQLPVILDAEVDFSPCTSLQEVKDILLGDDDY